MIYALDVQYNENIDATVACVGFENWGDEIASYQKTHYIEKIEPYEAGSFYKRELPCLLRALSGLSDIECVVVDGYVWLGKESHNGLGMHLFNALDRAVPVVGVAKTMFEGTPKRCEVLRGKSMKPLFVTSVKMELARAKELVGFMSGEYRIPTLLKEVDSLCRGVAR